MSVHAAMVDRMDQGIGRILAKLQEIGRADNTLIFFLSDNGASPEIPLGGGFDRPTETRDGRAMLYRGDLQRRGIAPGGETTMASIGPMWANAADTPFRYWKAETYEGGICTPLIVRWPAVIKHGGGISAVPGHLIDLMATAMDVSGAPFPSRFGDQPTVPPEGCSLKPTFEGKPISREAIFWEHEGNCAVQMGDWKAVSSYAGSGHWELYHLANDRTEMRDLAAQDPFRLNVMIAVWERWAQRSAVIPAPPPPRRPVKADESS